jgi:hypothetical protein
MTYAWDQLGQGREATHLLSVGGDRLAVVWFHGGFVERPDSWQLKIKGQNDTTSHETLNDAKRAAEQECVRLV